jgi:hypothetical protein
VNIQAIIKLGCVISVLCIHAGSSAFDLNIDLQSIYYPDTLSLSQKNQPSIALNMAHHQDWNDDSERFAAHFFYRQDSYRTHGDIRELFWRKTFENHDLDLYLGIKKVFWGVTESLHLVDIINQTDQLEDIDNEAKLGQPMLHLSYNKNWGTTDVFVMPFFRERSFIEQPHPFSLPLPVGESVFESEHGNRHIDYALRWSHALGDLDIGLSYFQGTQREPYLTALSPTSFTPNYHQTKQSSLDLQYIYGDILLKLEFINRHNHLHSSEASVTGLEYTFSNLFNNAVDLGLILEYQYDNELNSFRTTDNDVVLGTRIAFNGTSNTQILTLLSIDDTNNSKFYSIEASRRFGQSWTGSLTSRMFTNTHINDPSYSYKDNDYFELSIKKFLN